MTQKANFSHDEWNNLISFACIGVCYKYSNRDANSLTGIVCLIREMLSVQKFLASAMNKYGNLELLKEIISELTTNGKFQQDMINDDFRNFSNLEIPVARVNQILSEKATIEEARAMRAFTYEIAFEAANAAGDGFLGTGTKISQEEADFLNKLKSHLIEI